MTGRGMIAVTVGNVLGVIALVHVARNVPLLLRGDLSTFGAVQTLGAVAVVWWWLTWLIAGYQSWGRDTRDRPSDADTASRSDSRSSGSSQIATQHLTAVDRASRVSYRVFVVIAPLTMFAMIGVAAGLPLAGEAAAILTAALLLLSLLSMRRFMEQVADEDFAYALRWHAGFADRSSYDSRERSLIRAGLVSFLTAIVAWLGYLTIAF